MTLTMNSRAIPLLDRYEVNETTGCWLWLGYVNKDGYARAGSENAHRVFYREHVGDIPSGYDIDHLCKRRDCVNPAHLEAVTELENNRRRSRTVTLAGNKFDLCKEGHLIAGANRRIIRKRGVEYSRCWLCTTPAPVSDGRPRRRAAMQDAVSPSARPVDDHLSAGRAPFVSADTL